MGWVAAFALAMWSTVCSAALVGLWLWSRGGAQPGMRALAGFCLAMAGWCAGHGLVLLTGTVWQAWGVGLLLANPFIPTFFLHFAVCFIQPDNSPAWLYRLRRWIGGWYFLAGGVTVFSILHGDGQVQPWLDFPAFFVLNPTGWFNIIYTMLVGVIAHAVLFWGWRRTAPNKRRSIVAMFLAGGWGFVLATSFIFPSIGLEAFPYPMLLLPSYAILLVYGVVRYQLLEVNRWANRAMLWLAMLGGVLVVMALFSSLAARLGMDALARVPLWQLWFYSLLMLVTAWTLYGPAQTFADRLIYPGAQLDEGTLDDWMRGLRACRDWPELKTRAEALLSQHIGQAVRVHLRLPEAAEGLVITCLKGPHGWFYQLDNWQEVTPGIRQVGEVFGTLLSTSCRSLEQSLQLAEEERRRLAQQHLVELGGLSAAVAHELRNPLNIISMASAQCDSAVKQHIQGQLQRADHLIQDLLSYSGSLALKPQHFVLRPLVESVVQTTRHCNGLVVEIDMAPDLMLEADSHRVQQVLTNLLENAVAFACSQPAPRILITAAARRGDHDQSQHDELVLGVHNNGPAIAPEQQAELFQPFVSRRAGGFGLGLAIVRRIMQAHGGRVCYADSQGWPVSFLCEFPQPLDLKPNDA